MSRLLEQVSLLFYQLFLQLYVLGVRLAAGYNPKAKQWLKGREHIFEQIQKKYTPPEGSRVVWVHAASLGEFEQGRPLIEMLKEKQPETIVVLTFFSPSGYEVRKSYPHADYVFYLPMDSRKHARRFLSLIHPDLVIFIKYEFWYYYFYYMRKWHIPLVMVSCIFRPGHIFFRWYGWMHRAMLRYVTHFFVQDSSSALLLEEKGIHQVSVIPDTRIDRVASIARQAKTLPSIAQFLQGQKAFIGGSFYAKENELLHEAYSQGAITSKIIIAPHQVDAAHVEEIRAPWGDKAILYTEMTEDNIHDKQVLIVNTIGMLSSLYRYGSMAFIGGGFGKGIHNTLEPAAFHLPIIFGPNNHKFFEAEVLLHTGGAFCVRTAEELQAVLQKLSGANALATAAKASGAYIEENTGGTQEVYEWLEGKGLV